MMHENGTWVVTGGSSGIGDALVRRVRERGAEVVVWDVRRPQLDVRWAEVDLRDASAVAEAAAQVEEPVWCFAHVAGTTGYAQVGDADMIEKLHDQIALHCGGLLAALPALVPRIVEVQGSVVAVTALAERMIYAGNIPYAASKAALGRIVQSLAVELGRQGVRANTVAPGSTMTPLTERGFGDEERMAARRRQIPLGRVGRAEEVAAVIDFLASPSASYVNGETITVDGGLWRGLGSLIGTVSQEAWKPGGSK